MNGRKRLIALGGNGETTDEGAAPTGDGTIDVEQEAQDVHEDASETGDDYFAAWDEEEPDTRASFGRFGWVVPALASLAIAAWSGFFVWVHQREILAGASPEQWIGWIGDWSLPVLLMIGLWMLAMRNSRREAARFGETARMLSAEASALETRLAVVNRELSLARDFIASQSRDLESLGRVASERLSENADRLQALIRDNGEQVNTIGVVSDTALGNMNRLRDQLPVISNAARDLTSQIGNAGNTAQDRLDQLARGFERLNEFGAASARQVEDLGAKVDDTIAAFEAQITSIEAQSGARFDVLREQSEAYRVELEGRETDTLAAIRRRAAALGDDLAASSADQSEREDRIVATMHARITELRTQAAQLEEAISEGQREADAQWQQAIERLRGDLTAAIEEVSRLDEEAIGSARNRLEALFGSARQIDASIKESADRFETAFAQRRDEHRQREDDELSALETRLGAFDERVAERRQEHVEHLGQLADRADQLGQKLDDLDTVMASLARQGNDGSESLGRAGEALTERLSQSRAILEESKTFVGRLTDDSVRLLEIIRASSDHSEGALSQSIEHAEQRLGAFGIQANELHRLVADAEEKGSQLSDHLRTASQDTKATREEAEALEARLVSLAAQSEELARKSREELQDAISALEQASVNALSKLRSEQGDAVREIGQRIGSEGTQAIERALKDGTTEAIAELEDAARSAGERGRETVVQLRDQLAKVNELASNLERRVSQARSRAEEQVDTDFSRRMALITESLNSSSIDISKAFDTEVTDTAWSGYLRGDRGIFTRRAVRLLDNHEARAVTEIYEQDAEFRETVNRYIHDFEAMLRSVLSTRDGNSLGVTLLSSDMGKLYVALAQSIERLRR